MSFLFAFWLLIFVTNYGVMSNFGVNIKKIRNLKNYTQQDVGDVLGLTRAAVSSYEEGRAEPKIETLVRSAQIFGVSIDDLINKKLTINELVNFKGPELAIGTQKIESANPMFPPDAIWISISNAIIIDTSLNNNQIVLARPDQIRSNIPQIVDCEEGVFIATLKKIEKGVVVMKDQKISEKNIHKVQTILGFYQSLEDISGSMNVELAEIKLRLSALEKHLQ
ncbi:helix-turn-helix domain-containing protein [Niabella ginsengisoli]|uniref:Helix-turn-helix transcriptional regulator n=1 Tax=Niabella ginsengisoli TaxID=522298 RepID=A0ABS9SEW4_9BACT|nr:helix-turn-helix transcriptional regulator [Niabella ginsengisoli]MCH5596907.1 helix-turn-helix transcriptional regulator [Niabella ginsengisoli]